ncbi:MAG: Spy/CpxP family protein refolding chaperone [Nitrospira sp.]|nr:Spy/CpxP family protein refolding chaperone [Nitrospira sp.]
MKPATSLMLGLALGSALIGSSVAWADGGDRCAGKTHQMSYHQGGHRHGGFAPHLFKHLLKNREELRLTDEQVAKLRTIALDADRARIRAEADVMVSERELRSMMWDDTTQLPAIEAKIKEGEAYKAAARIIGIKAARELIGVLTPEQQAKQKTLWKQYRHHRHQGAEADQPPSLSSGIGGGTGASVVEESAPMGGPSAG